MRVIERRSPLRLIALLLIALLVVPVLGWSGAAAAAGFSAPTSLSGLVAADTGEPLASARVELFLYGSGLVGSATTGADGRFQIGLPASRERLYWVRAWAAGHETAEQVWVASLAVGASGTSAAGESPFLRLSLAPVAGSVAGWVEGPDGHPVVKARVELTHTVRGVVGTTETTPAGRFWFKEVPSGADYSLRVSASGMAPSVSKLSPVAAGRESSLTVELQPYQGQVTGVVVDPKDSLPLKGATISIEQVGVGIVGTAVAGTGGTFTAPVPVVADATYRLHARMAGHLPATTEPFKLDAQGWARLDGERRIKLPRLTTELSVRVLDSDGDPLPGAPLWLEREGVGIVAIGTTDDDGSFQWADVATNGSRYRVRTVPPVLTKQHSERKWADAATEWVVPVSGQRTHLGLTLSSQLPHNYGEGEIVGRVTGRGGAPVEGVKAELHRAGKGLVATTQTGADGTYRFTKVEANEPKEQTFFMGRALQEPGTAYVVRVEHPDYFAAASERVDVRPSTQGVADLSLVHRTGTAVIHVVDQTGLPVTGAELRLSPAGGGEPITATTDAAGIGRLRAPVLGSYWLEAERAGLHRGQASPLLLTPGEDRVVTLTMADRAGTAYGQVEEENGRPVAGSLKVVALTPDGEEVAAPVREDGSYELADLPSHGPVLLSLREGDRPVAALDRVLLVPPGEHIRADLKVTRPSGEIRGQVLDASGQPATGMLVELWRSGEGRVAMTRTGPDGSYHFDQLPAGAQQRYAVRVEAPGFGYRKVGNRMPPPLILLDAETTEYLDLILFPLGR